MHPILSTSDAAKLLNCTPEKIRRWCREGYLPAVKIGREWRISAAALEDWWQSQGGGRLQLLTATAGSESDSEESDRVDATESIRVRRILRR